MLQRAASNAYSWWWASHIRTKQSKWLEESLQDMEEKVQHMLVLIQEDGDSFAKRAEMYYKRRPELINFVEESYRGFRSLAERYDKLSKDLQSVNHTLATLCPEQFQLDMDEDDEYGSPKPPPRKNFPRQNPKNVPKVPKAPSKKKLKVIITTATVPNKLQPKKPAEVVVAKKAPPKSGLTITQATEEVDRLQKDILKLQTAKEFVKSSYQSGLAKCRAIEDQISEMQQRVCALQDEFGVTKAIEDDVARTLMAKTALKSCRETLAQLQERQERASREAREEYKKIGDCYAAHIGLKNPQKSDDKRNERNSLVCESGSSSQEVCCDAMEESLRPLDCGDSMGALTVTELVEKIDELVNKVVDLENTISAQTLEIDRLKEEANDFQTKAGTLKEENDKTETAKENQMNEMEKKWKDIQNLNQGLEKQRSSLRKQIAEASWNLDHLSEKLKNVKPDEEEEDEEELEGTDSPQSEAESLTEFQPKENMGGKPDTLEDSGACALNSTSTERKEGEEVSIAPNTVVIKNEEEEGVKSESEHLSSVARTPAQKVETSGSPGSEDNGLKNVLNIDLDKDDEQNWREMLLNGMGDKEKAILKEYTTVLRNYKELKKKLTEIEKKDRDNEFEFTLQISELKSAIAKRDEEIQQLRQRVNVSLSPDGGAEKKEPSESTAKEQESRTESSKAREEDSERPQTKDDEDGFMLPALINKPVHVSPVEEKLRGEIDAILDENLDFWLRFSSSFHQIQKFKTTVQDLQHELSKVKEKKTQENSAHSQDLRSEVRPIFKHLREIHTELTVWLDQSGSLKDELKRRSSSLCHIQEEITIALREGVEGEEIQFSSHQAAKFQGEVLNMKQENNKVREELQAGVDHVTILQLEVEKTLKKLGHEFGLSGGNPQLKHSASRSKIPLGSFIFGNKPKKHKKSVFSCIHPNKKYQVLRAVIDL
ncbi:hypothetical protein DM860_009610 [Cuscuta australis]|uniref:NAB domain-containing protein n=1 Tax=Cuscuta australis TaxID=267555 RepID=A0A328DJW5_9ASTE|nr:hypothetical protein DM860_009610 [Cuscuta australis]